MSINGNRNSTQFMTRYNTVMERVWHVLPVLHFYPLNTIHFGAHKTIF